MHSTLRIHKRAVIHVFVITLKLCWFTGLAVLISSGRVVTVTVRFSPLLMRVVVRTPLSRALARALSSTESANTVFFEDEAFPG